ncbi:melanoma-associated antigen B4-like [Acomys russatus]|uniref:melanoma-associated antigen B4-like n=1 Tax=Acomys russatus TaxID=60746 RepID=UPI0021E2AFE1|nr:melanoma-associated antigen B4-like [Acomys russatus]
MVLIQCHFAPPDFCFARSPAYSLVLLPLSQAIMPRGHKSKGRSRTKRQNVQKSQSLHDALPTEKEEATSVGQGDPPSSPGTDTPQNTQAVVASVSDDSSVFSGAVGGEASVFVTERRLRVSLFASSMFSERKDPLNRKAGVLLEFMLEKFKAKEPFTEEAMLRVINKKYKVHFTEIIRRISVRLELVFGLELKKVDPRSQSYMLMGKLGLSTEGHLSGGGGLPKTGLLMTLLAVIFMNGNISSEEDIWDFLSMVGIYPGRNHPIFGEPKKFITEDLVAENYLQYHPVYGTDPQKYVFMWGYRAHTETTKMKVLEVLAKINDDVPSSFPALYEEALLDEANRAARRVTAVPGNVNPRPHFRFIAYSSSHK